MTAGAVITFSRMHPADQHGIKRLARFAVALGILVGSGPADAANPAPPAPTYVGSGACTGCHADQSAAWRGSMHALAWQQPTPESVLGDFNDAVFEHRGVTTRFTRRDGAFVIETQGADGAVKAFPMAGVAGVAPLQQYLLETEPGRLQAFDVAWDVVGKRWYHLYPDADLPPEDGLHWTGPYKNWNARCAECHATGFAKNYAPKSHRYASAETEIGVGCEACHGPGEAHLEWTKAPTAFDPARRRGLTREGLTIGFTEASAETEIQQCAGCHSRRDAIGDTSPVPGTPYHDSYRLALLRDGLYYADGSIRDEVYVYGSFLQSRMYAQGVRCSDCHDPHRAAVKPDPDPVCLQCHSPAGNPRFPRLARAEYADPSHHFHKPSSDGAKCVSCHMVERTYMGIDGRRDHSFRIPRPDLAAETGAPDPCTGCHTGRDAGWAAAAIAQRFPQSTHRGPHFSQTFAAARRDPAKAAEDLLRIAEGDGYPAIVRASALDLLRGATDAAAAVRAAHLIGDPDPLVREAAIGTVRALPPSDRADFIGPALDDPTRSVRIAAAREILAVPREFLPAGLDDRIRAAMSEWRASLLVKADFPETQLAIAGVALVLKNMDAAEQAFREAVALDPQLVQAWAMIARILAASGDMDGARAALEDGLRSNPSDRTLLGLQAEIDAATSR